MSDAVSRSLKFQAPKGWQYLSMSFYTCNFNDYFDIVTHGKRVANHTRLASVHISRVVKVEIYDENWRRGFDCVDGEFGDT